MDNVVINITEVVPEVEVNVFDSTAALRGGTTGQVLTKASDADLDFTWGAGGGGGSVDSVTSADTDRITIGGTATDPTVNIAAAYDAAVTAEIAAAIPNYEPLFISETNLITHTGTVTPTKVISWEIPANFFQNGDHWWIYCWPLNSGASATMRLLVNTSDSLVGAVQLGTYTYSNSVAARFIRTIYFNSANTVRVLASTLNVATDISGNGYTSMTQLSMDSSVTLYIMLEVTLTSSGLTTTISDIKAGKQRLRL